MKLRHCFVRGVGAAAVFVAIGASVCSVSVRAQNEPASDSKPISDGKNLYLAREGLSPTALLEFIERMKSKPKSIRSRPGFSLAILDAADRILAADADAAQKNAALVEKLQELHFQACQGDSQGDEAIRLLLPSIGQGASQELQREARFLDLEQRVMGADELPAEKLAGLLTEVRDFFADHKPDARELRLASATVRVINRLPDEDAAKKYYAEIGGLLAKSSDRQLGQYGTKIAAGVKAPSRLGQPLEISGTLLDGTAFDWTAYRGKVVLVDFWATWCGPCRAELPNLKATYDALHSSGFEVVGVSLDTDREALEAFLAAEDIRWPNLFAEGEAGGWKHPAAIKLNIEAIPATFLVDRAGKVVATDLRGPALAAKLEELLGKARKPAENKPEK